MNEVARGGLEKRPGGFDHPEIRKHLQAELGRPYVVIEFEKTALRDSAGIGYQNVETAPGGADLGDDLPCRVRNKEVQRCRPDLLRECEKFGAGRLKFFPAAGHRLNARPSLREPPSDRLADSPARSGDEYSLIGKHGISRRRHFDGDWPGLA
jgi:hypothetical protein